MTAIVLLIINVGLFIGAVVMHLAADNVNKDVK